MIEFNQFRVFLTGLKTTFFYYNIYIYFKCFNIVTEE